MSQKLQVVREAVRKTESCEQKIVLHLKKRLNNIIHMARLCVRYNPPINSDLFSVLPGSTKIGFLLFFCPYSAFVVEKKQETQE